MSTSLTWIIFLPLLTAGIILCLPASWRFLIKSVGVIGAFITFMIANGVTREYMRAEADPANASGAARNVVAALEDLKPMELRSLEAPLAARVEALLPKPGEAPRKLTDTERTELGAQGVETWERLSEFAYAQQVATAKNLRFVEFAPWIPMFKINYFLAVDGLSLPLVWLTTLLGVICLIYSWTIDKGTKGYYALFLILQTGLAGVFLALDFFLFYVFWEVVLLPMYFLIGVWGGPNRIYAAIKFFIYTLVGSVVMLLCMLVMYFQAEPHTFNVLTLTQLSPAFAYELQWWLFIGLFLGFAIKVPIFPFHTWLPDAHVEAPTAVSVVLAGVLLKMGGYGFFRFSYPMLPNAALAKPMIWFIAILAMINIVYGAFCALAQKDFKKLVAYSSVSHMGYVMLGLAAFNYSGIDGAALQMFNHGVSSAMLFLIVGVIYDRAHHRDLNRFGGIGVQMPWYTGIATVGFFASLGLPGLNGFIGEVLVFLGAWDHQAGLITHPTAGINAPWIIYVSLLGIVLAAVYILWTIQRVYLVKPVEEQRHPYPEIGLREAISLLPLAGLCIVVGVFPQQTILKHIDPSLKAMTDMVRAAAAALK
jgi:NADH-quinone oxidoreductase subunit M